MEMHERETILPPAPSFRIALLARMSILRVRARALVLRAAAHLARLAHGDARRELPIRTLSLTRERRLAETRRRVLAPEDRPTVRIATHAR